jgi:CoA-dependent NAD(P)H sulfur oxidoreductase
MINSKKRRRILIVGGLAAGPSAAAKAIRVNPNSEVILFEAGDTVSYGICEAPYAISGVIDDEQKLVIYTPEQLREEKNIQVKTLHRVEKIFPSKHRIIARDFRNQTATEYEYDKLILTTGAKPRRLFVDGEDGRNVFHLRSRDDTRSIKNYINTEFPKKAVIIGGGYIGMEMSEALRAKGLDVTLIHQYQLPMSGLEQGTRERILEELQKNEVHFKVNTRVEAFHQKKDGRVQYVLTNKGPVETDLVIISIGVEPNIELAKQAKLRLGSTGAIATNEQQLTSVDDVYAAGDCCEVKNIVSGKPMYLPFATYASRAAWVAGENAAGGRAVFHGAIRAVAVKVFGLEVAHVGLSSAEAKDARFQMVTETITAHEKISSMPGSEKITITLIVDKRSKRLLGANVYGRTGVVLRANTLGVAIQHKLTIDDIARFDLIYTPPVAPLWDPILIAANRAKKKF